MASIVNNIDNSIIFMKVAQAFDEFSEKRYEKLSH